MRTVSYRLVDLNNATLNLGFVGENEHTRVIFDSKKMFEQYPDAVASLAVKPPVGDPYPAVTTCDGDFVIWDVTDSDLAAQGMGEVQLSFTEDGKVAKTYKAKTRISGSVMPTGEIPSPVDDWLTRANAALADIPQTIDDALEEAKESGEFKGDPGEDGYTPVKGVDYFDGQDGQDGVNGKDGEDGQDGTDGISPTVTVTDITGGHRVVITDAEGDHPFDVMDGQGGGGTVTVDDELSDTSTNPVQNKVITGEVTSLREAIADKQDAPSVAGSSGQAMMLDNSGNPVWQTPPGGMVTDTVTGATVSITGQANHRYLCGTVTEITITPPQTGMIDVLFTAGNACVLSLPNTVKLPDSFDPTTLTQGVVYEINIMDGVYGVVGSWT